MKIEDASEGFVHSAETPQSIPAIEVRHCFADGPGTSRTTVVSVDGRTVFQVTVEFDPEGPFSLALAS